MTSSTTGKSVGLFLLVFLVVAYAPILSMVDSGIAAIRSDQASYGVSAPDSARSGQILPLLVRKGIEAPFKYFASDAYYYLTVAHNSVGMPFYTFDHIFPTNGFHPLWQLSLTSVFSLLHGNQMAEILATFFLSILLTALGSAFFALAVHRLTGSGTLTLLGTVPGVYYLLFSRINQHFDAQWSFINGMESPLSILFVGLLLYLIIEKKILIRPSPGKLLAVSGLLTLVTLSRLDDVFLFISLFTFLALWSGCWAEARNRIGIALIVPIMVIGLYLLYNLRQTGLVLPVSALTKGGLAIGDNLGYLANAFIPFTQGFYVHTYEWQELTWRIIQVVVPLVVASAWLLRSVREMKGNPAATTNENSYHQTVLMSLCVYILVKALYNLFSVNLLNQGNWYFPVSIMLTNMLIVVQVSAVLPRQQPSRATHRPLLLGLAVLFTILTANSFVDAKRTSEIGGPEYHFWERRNVIWGDLSRTYRGRGIIEFDDGIIAYSLPIPALGGLGFTLDKEAFEAKRNGNLLDLAYRRGFRVFASLKYLNYASMPESIGSDSDQLQKIVRSCFFLRSQKLDPWHFTLVYHDDSTGAVFIEFSPRSIPAP